MSSKLRCLVIDDDRDFLDRVRRWFVASCTDFEVVPFANALDAVEYARTRRVDLICTAYLMPQIDGLRLISIIRSFNAHVPILMLSHVPIQAAALARGATRFCAKALVWSQLGAALAGLRARHAPLAA